MEDRQVIRSYKFGLLYAKDGQSTEQEIFRNKLGMCTFLSPSPSLSLSPPHSRTYPQLRSSPQYFRYLTSCFFPILCSNHADDSSKAFKEFLNFIGERIELKNWKGYRAGLDVNGNHPPSGKF